MSLKQVQLYDDRLEFVDNKEQGPFGDYTDLDDAYINKGEPQYDFFGTPVYSPFGIAAGPLPTSRHIQAALIKGYDIVTLKSVRTDTFPVNVYPQVRPVATSGDLSIAPDVQITLAAEYTQPLAVANSFGIPSVRPEEWQPEMRKSLALPNKGQALLAAFQGTARGKGRDDFVQDHVIGVGQVRNTGASVIEINLSCPNEGEAVLACFDADITERIVTAVRAAYPDIKLLIKIAYFADKVQLKNLIKRVGGMLDGVSAINTMPTAVINSHGEPAFPGRPKAGISGAPIKWAGLEMTKFLHEYRADFGYKYKIVGIGGVVSAADFHDYRKAGADFIMSVTGAMWLPELARQVKDSL